jgi:hypothetical protein
VRATPAERRQARKPCPPSDADDSLESAYGDDVLLVDRRPPRPSKRANCNDVSSSGLAGGHSPIVAKPLLPADYRSGG